MLELRILLEKQMISFSESLKFEEAGSVRDQLKGIDRLYESQKMIIPDSSVCRDIIAMASEENISSVQISFVYQINLQKLNTIIFYCGLMLVEQLSRKEIILN